MKRVIVVGAGNMGRKWLRTIVAHAGTDAVAVVDVDVERARSVADAEGAGDAVVGAALADVVDRVDADVVVDATIPAAHRSVTVEALRAGLAVLGEKPAAPTLAESIALAAAVEATGGVFVVSQSRRFNAQLVGVQRFLAGCAAIGGMTSRFSRGPRFGGFRDEMESPLVVDMAIHLFDMARWIARATPIAVYARESNPPWSWYRGDASARAVVEFADGSDFVFDGTWAGVGADTSWNGQWWITTDRGTIVWDGDTAASVQADASAPALAIPPAPDAVEGLPGALSAFLQSLDEETVAENEIHDNLRSLAIVEATLASARRGQRVTIESVLDEGRAQALAGAQEWDMPEIVPVLNGWESVSAALDAVVPGAPRARRFPAG